MPQGIIEKLYEEHATLSDYLGRQEEPSFKQLVTDNFRKTLALSVASLFENLITDAVLKFCEIRGGGDPGLICLVRMKAVEKQYFKYFDWDNKSANHFYSMFGDPFGVSMKAEVKANPELKRGCEAFLELGYMRNCLVHQNFATFSFEKTAEEVYAEYRDAEKFVSYLVSRLSLNTKENTANIPGAQ